MTPRPLSPRQARQLGLLEAQAVKRALFVAYVHILGSIIARLDALTARLDRHLGSADDQP
jgi:hypothetical protein